MYTVLSRYMIVFYAWLVFVWGWGALFGVCFYSLLVLLTLGL